MSGSWRLDTYQNKGDFKATLYLQGPTPMAPLLLLGAMDGVLRRPQAQVKGGGSGSQAAGSGSSGSGSKKFSISSKKTQERSALAGEGRDRVQGASKKLVKRTFVGHWNMPSM